MIKRLRLENKNCEIDKKTLSRNVKELKVNKRDRVYHRKNNKKIDILAKSNKVKRNQ